MHPTTEPDLSPSEVRARILSEHVFIRSRAEQLLELIQRVRAGDRSAEQALIQEGCAFLEDLIRHIEHENRVLVPALREIDAWGEVRADEVLAEHREQVAEARSLIEALADAFTRASVAADQLEDFLAILATDMASEERLLLSPDLLRDDVVGIDVEGG